ncbi:Rho GTPase-activating protein domain protein [Cordyceps fumosorosea ARSEF 2679]|uniref:Rho GTPase-activating protein domain protein n=1 Tax=Cordyceps fumosorosea (strain ARSEF 2679) TaxID=1081104 RepID=A0A167NLZ6_CORFA|nr:Rho GTPase-activating protein domain protein [Cordyceps fumosorosea ARSEF 2679]OAA55702.1 Rho GTPase-activating protein domain protein [Cordyceps fumosorosea ARSEF 2679]
MSSEFRGPGDDALPAPPGQPPQPQPSAPAGKTSEDSGSRELVSEKERLEGLEGESDDDKSAAGDAPDGAAPSAAPPPPDAHTPSAAEAALMKQVNAVLSSEIGIATLLNRLKQSAASAKEFAMFLKKRAIIEDDHAQSLKKLCRTTQDNMRRADHRTGSFAQSYDEMTYIHDRMADNGIQFAASLHQMHEDLIELANNSERSRKTWKTNGLSAEQKVADLEQAMRKSKAKYDSLAEEYDRARTGEGRQGGGKVLGAFKAHKSAAQQEEDLLKKAQNADQTYYNHVQTLRTEKSQLEASHRPEAVKALQALVSETDSATTLQMQKFATFNEKLLLGNGLIVYPFKNQPGDTAPQPRSLRQAVSSINNERDFNEFVSAQHSKVSTATEVKYEKNPLLNPQSSAAPRPHSQPFAPPGQQGSISSFGPLNPAAAGGISNPISQQPQSMGGARSSTGNFTGPNGPGSPQSPVGPGQVAGVSSSGLGDQSRPFSQQHTRSYSQGNPLKPGFGGLGGSPPQYGGRGGAPPQAPAHQADPRYGNGQPGAPQLGALPFQGGNPPGQRGSPQQGQQPFGPPGVSGPGGPGGPGTRGSPQQSQLPFRPPSDVKGPVGSGGGLPGALQPGSQHPQGQPPAYPSAHGTSVMASQAPTMPVFGVSLAKLYERDGLAVPMVVYQCIQAVDMYGLGVEGIYRQSGSLTHINKLKSMFDADSQNPALDFRNPESFYHDVNSVTGLLKQFFRDLPDPILTAEHYSSFINAAKHEDDIVRRDSLHAIINALPDPNYATLRAITLHLYRVMDNAHLNRMTSHNLAVIFGPTLMGSDPSTAMTDAGWQIKVVDTILQNTYQIFDED